MKKLGIIFIFISFISKAQVNLVLNPSFEDTLSYCLTKFGSNCCPSGADLIMMSKYWSGPDTIQFRWAPPYATKPNGACCVPEFFSSCGTSYFSVPGKYQPAKSGQAYAELATYMSVTLTWQPGQTLVARRNYLKGRLKTPLTQGKEYCASFYFNLYNYSQWATDAIGMFISNTTALDTAKCYNPMTFFTPQVQYSGGIMLDTLNWIKVENTFIATGGENYVVIGNFKSDANTNKTLTNFPNPNALGAAYLIDDVSIIPTDLMAYAGPDKNILFGDSVFIGRPPEPGLNCVWSTGTTTIGTSSGIWVKPTITTTYVVQQSICGITKSDTVTVNVDYVGIKEVSAFHKDTEIRPNPNNGSFNVHFNNSNGLGAEINIIDLTGKIILKEFIQGSVSDYKINMNLHEGYYLIKIKFPNGNINIHRVVVI